jgi:hypothetical protein
MRGLTLSAAAIALMAFTTVQAGAESNAWGPNKNGTQCYNNSPGWGGPNAGMFGYWGPCPTPAATQRSALLRHPLRPRRDPHNDR